MNVPKLRFKDDNGQDFPEWEEKKIGQLLQVTTGARDTQNKVDNGVYPFFVRSQTVERINSFSYDGEAILTSGDGVGVGKNFHYINGKFDYHQRVYCLSKFNSNALGKYVYFYFSTFFNKRVMRLSAKNSVDSVRMDMIVDMPIYIPTVEEQTKIANFLTAVDDKIAELTKKVALLQRYKKGAMQQIFGQQLRFKDDNGQDFPEWEEKTLGSIFSFITTNSFSRELLTYDEGIVKNIHYGDIHKKFKSNFHIKHEQVPFISSHVDISRISENCYCKEGDLIVADASEDYADIGKSIEIISLDNQRLLAGLHTYILRDVSKCIALGFSGYLMQTEHVRLQMKTLATGISVLGISKGNLAKIYFWLPSLPEQTKIANFLSALDEQINTSQQQLELSKQYKQSLLQQMFI